MTEALERRHGLELRVSAWPADSGISLEIRDDLGHLNLRGSPDDDAFVKAAGKALGQALPIEPNTVSEGGVTIFWLGPDEWLVLAPSDEIMNLAAALEKSLTGRHFAANVVSGGQIAMTLKGGHVRHTLAKGCTLDFHPQVFTRGQCAQGGLAKCSTLLGAVGDDNEFLIVVRRSFSDYLVSWLERAV